MTKFILKSFDKAPSSDKKSMWLAGSFPSNSKHY